MERFMFFDPVETSPGVFDREYTSEEFVRYFATLINTGLMKGFGNELAVTCTGTDLISRIDTGTMFINGRYYENTEVLSLEHDAETLSQNRIDRVVIRLDLRTEGRHVKAFIKKGNPAPSPVAPELQRDANVYEMSLARVYITGGQGFFISANITDDRTNPTLCPYATSGILPNLNEAAFTDHVNNTTTAHGINTHTSNTTTAHGINTKAPLASPAFTGTPTAPTAAAGTENTQIATTAFVQSTLGSVAGKIYAYKNLGGSL